MRARRLVAAACSATCVLGVTLPGQQRMAGAELWGRVLLAGDTVALPGTVVEVVGVSARTTASQTGFYRFAQLAAGPHELRVRRIGYESLSIPVALRDGEAERRDISLIRLPSTLTEVRVEGRARKVPPRFEDVYRRMTTANGKFFTREDIELLQPLDIPSLMLQVPTVRVNSGGLQFAKCNEGGARALSSGGGKVQIYIDGLRMTGRQSQNRRRVPATADDPEVREQIEVMRMVHPTQIQAMEVYTGVARIPGQFLEDACAVIAIWTKSY